MKKILLALVMCLVCVPLAVAGHGSLIPVKHRTRHDHVKHHAHRTAKHHARKHYRSV